MCCFLKGGRIIHPAVAVRFPDAGRSKQTPMVAAPAPKAETIREAKP